MEEHPSHNEKLKEKRAAYPSNNEKLDEHAAPPSKNKKKVKESNADRRKRLVLLCSQSHRDQDARNKVLAAERAETIEAQRLALLIDPDNRFGPRRPLLMPPENPHRFRVLPPKDCPPGPAHPRASPPPQDLADPANWARRSVENYIYILVSERSPPATRNHAIEYLRESLRACNAPNPDLTQHDPVFLQGLRECQAIVDSALYKIPELKDYLRPPPT